MIKNNLIKQITDKVVDSNPDEYLEQTGDQEWSLKRPFNLEDVLQIDDTGKRVGKSREENVIMLYDFLEKYWQLGKPLHEQDEECLKFIWDTIK